MAANNFPAALPGPFAFHKTFHIQGGGSVNTAVAASSDPGITLTIDNTSGAGPDSAGGTGELLMDSNAAVIAANDVFGNGLLAGPITITTSGNVIMQAGSKITATNSFDGGAGGVITITVNGSKMVMCGPSGSTDAACSGPHALAGAVIDVSNNSGNTATAGKVFITVGAAPVGRFLMGGSANVGGTDFAGALVQANSSHGLAGEIDIKAGDKVVEEPGAKVLSIAGSGDSSHGGPISLVSGCQVLVSGEVSSIGPDPGADLVHVEGCEVHVTSTGLIQSTAPAHAGASGKCALNGHASDAGVCVEIWARHVIIDAGGEVNANFALSGGTTGSGWIDIYAQEDIVINGPPVGTTFPSSTVLKFAVHSNSLLGNDVGGVVTVKAKNSTITMTGQALQASATANGSSGGSITVEASQLVNLDTATLEAAGDNVGGGIGSPPPCDGGSGACGKGGQIAVRSWNDAITWQNGVGNVNPDNGVAPPAGSISLTACTTVTTAGTAFDNAAPTVNTGGAFCAVGPTIPAYVVFNPGGTWDTCGESSISGHKFDSGHNNAPLPGWTIHITGPGVDTTAVTDANGLYTFIVPGGQTYKVCEVLKDSTWTQTLPVAGSGVVACNGPGEAPLGYEVTLNVGGACCGGAKVTGKDFANQQELQPPTCPEDTARAPFLTRTVDPSKPAPGGGTGDAGSPINYVTIQGAYDAAKVSPNTKDEVIGLFAKTAENVVLDGYTAKSMTITQCTNASATSWDLKANKKLLIIGPDSTGGAIGWYLETGGHELKSIRSNGASAAGVRIKAGANGNKISFNNVASGGIGIDVLSNSNTLKSGTIGPNSGAGVHIGSGNTGNLVSGMTIQMNNNNGVWVEGNSNTISSDRLNNNSPNGIKVTGSTNTIQSNQSDSNAVDGYNIAGTGNIVKDNKASNNTQDGFDLSGTGQKLTGSQSNQNASGAFDYRISATSAVSAPSGNKADGSSIPSASKCTGFFTNPAVLTCN